MKKGLLLILVALVSLFFVAPNKANAEAEETWQLVTNVDDLHAGDQVVITNTASTHAIGTNQKTSNREGVAVTTSEGNLVIGDTVEVLTLEAGLVENTYAFKASTGYLYAASNSSNHLKTKATLDNNGSFTISITSAGVASINAQGTNSRNQMRFNPNNGSPLFSCYDSAAELNNMSMVSIYVLTGAEQGGSTDEPEVPETPVEPELTPVDNEVKALFGKYYDNISYTKETVLNINQLTAAEVKLYFHNSQDVRYRNTVYTKNGLTMTTSADGITYGDESTYTNGTNCVNHTGFGGNWTVTQYKSVEEWFVTLKDFKDSTLSGWTVDNNVYTYVLTPTTATEEHEMTRMAREFVAPMWLAPNATNWGYVTFTKLTVEEIESSLIMKLYVSSGNEGQLLEGSDLVFAQAEITYPPVITSVEEALEAEDGAKVELTGTVISIDGAWNDTFNNMNVTIQDEEGNTMYVYRVKTKVALGDIITVTGVMGTYNEERQVAEGSTAEIIDHDSSYDYKEITIKEALAATDGTNVVVTGTVVKIGTAYDSYYKNISVYIADEEGTQLYLYRLSGNVTVGQIIKVEGSMATYSGQRQVTGGTFEAVGTHTCSNYTKATCLELAKCIVCEKTTGELTEHAYGEDGTCTVCGHTEGAVEVEKITATKTMAELITALKWTSSTTKQSFNLDDNVTVKINGGSNTGKAYEGTHIRIYATDSPAGTITISVPDGYQLVSVKVSTLTGTYAYLYVSGTSTDICNKTVSVSGNSVVLNSVKNGSNGKQVRVTAIEVVYQAVA